MIWLQPAAWWGLAALAIPVLIHLLARYRSRRVRFPSLRFLRVTQMTALKRRVVADWPLLAVRALVIAAATAALAAPVWVSQARRASWDQRIARAIVLLTGNDNATKRIAADEARGTFVAAEFTTDVAADGLREAVEWLERQPPAAREVVIVGDLRDGAIIDADLKWVPPFVGVRLLPVPTAANAATVGATAIAEGSGERLHTIQQHVRAEDERTEVRYDERPPIDISAVHVVAAAEDQAHADAILRAVLREGVWRPDDGRRVTIAFAGAPMPAGEQPVTTPWMRGVLEEIREVRGGETDGALVVHVNLRAIEPGAVDLVAHVIRRAFTTPFDGMEPRRIAPSTIARWSRPIGQSPPNVLPREEGDRRWFWMLTLALLGVEQVIRRRRASSDSRSLTSVEGEARVA